MSLKFWKRAFFLQSRGFFFSQGFEDLFCWKKKKGGLFYYFYHSLGRNKRFDFYFVNCLFDSFFPPRFLWYWYPIKKLSQNCKLKKLPL